MFIDIKLLESKGFVIQVEEDAITIFPDTGKSAAAEQTFPFAALNKYLEVQGFSKLEQDKLVDKFLLSIIDTKILQLIMGPRF